MEPRAENAGAALAVSNHGMINTPSTTAKLGAHSLVRPCTIIITIIINAWLVSHQHSMGTGVQLTSASQLKAGFIRRAPWYSVVPQGGSQLHGWERLPSSPAAAFRQAPGLDGKTAAD